MTRFSSLTPTSPVVPDSEHARWSRIFAPAAYVYGDEPGPIARRAVRYHLAGRTEPGTALDAGCGEGQDLAFLAERGYTATGVEFVEAAARKSAELIASHPGAEVVHADLRHYLKEAADSGRQFDLVLASNSLQFLGRDAPACVEALMGLTAPGGVLALSLFAREALQPEQVGTVYFFVFEELLARFSGWQYLEAAKLWQWNVGTNTPQLFATLIARNVPPVNSVVSL